MKWYKFNFDEHYDDVYGRPDAEDLAYRRLMDLYYRIEGPLPADAERLEKEIGLDWDCIEPILLDFFILDQGNNTWIHEAWQADIAQRKRIAQNNSRAGRLGGRKKALHKVEELK